MARVILSEKQFKEYARMILKEERKKQLVTEALEDVQRKAEEEQSQELADYYNNVEEK